MKNAWQENNVSESPNIFETANGPKPQPYDEHYGVLCSSIEQPSPGCLRQHNLGRLLGGLDWVIRILYTPYTTTALVVIELFCPRGLIETGRSPGEMNDCHVIQGETDSPKMGLERTLNNFRADGERSGSPCGEVVCLQF
ncbi:hypothetical protein I7I51_01791 [Histoplasma capsulatum]|uniref:Uncharacterized protein n=1 Tax=Ajellomyces capsulatus TaxID=5037 RepID=A0A8A1MHX9_AJECA|nr:hypothetical protein I7I51_01791 [Histoplasma capsulatum]